MGFLNENRSLFYFKLEKDNQTGNGIENLCPAYDDNSPSLAAYLTKAFLRLNLQYRRYHVR